MQLTASITLAVMALYFWISLNVAKARIKHNVAAPSMDGPVEFQSAYRVQANTVEQLVLFLPLLWLCAVFLGDPWAAGGGAMWLVGRLLYALGYYKDPKKRSAGFSIGMAAVLFLFIATIVGLAMHAK